MFTLTGSSNLEVSRERSKYEIAITLSTQISIRLVIVVIRGQIARNYIIVIT